MSWAYSALRASHEKKGLLIYGVVAYLLKQGAVLFDDEKDNSSQSVKLLMIQMQRIMAEKMVAAPRKQLLRNWVRAMRHAKAWLPILPILKRWCRSASIWVPRRWSSRGWARQWKQNNKRPCRASCSHGRRRRHNRCFFG